MLDTLKSAVVPPTRKCYEAGETANRYQEQFEKTRDPRDRELAHVYRCLAQGKQLISVNKAMQVAGVRANGEPVLAIAAANAKWVWYVHDGGWFKDPDGNGQHLKSGFVSDYSINPNERKRSLHRASRKDTWLFSREFFPVRPKEFQLRARVPIVPVKLRPKIALSNFQILWEADWQKAPVDPLLLRRVTSDMYEVIAEWDLTEVERLVLEMAAFSGQ